MFIQDFHVSLYMYTLYFSVWSSDARFLGGSYWCEVSVYMKPVATWLRCCFLSFYKNSDRQLYDCCEKDLEISFN